jgi:hypothetical protein
VGFTVCPGTAVERGGTAHLSYGVAGCHSLVDRLSVISSIGNHGGNRSSDLIVQVRQRRDIADVVGRQFAGTDFLGIGVNHDVQFPPVSARPDPVLLIQPLALAIDLEAGAVDQQMQRLQSAAE